MNILRQEKNLLTATIRRDGTVRASERLRLAVTLSIPAIMAQISAIIMQYIDASMVGSLGAEAAASIGLVTTTTWIFFGLCSAVASGFAVQVAHSLGANQKIEARNVLRQSLSTTLFFSVFLAVIGWIISSPLPIWLGGNPDICPAASEYFLIIVLAMPIFELSYLGSAMLRSSGNMFFPGMVGVLVCVLDVLFNFIFIFPSRTIDIFGTGIWIPGLGLGVRGAALGTMTAEIVAVAMLLYQLLVRSPELSLIHEHGSYIPTRRILRRARMIAMPMGIERFLTSGAQVMLTVIVAPLGTCSIAANAFAITAESICYMPGYGIADAATTLVGQSLGAGKKLLARKFAYTCVAMGVTIMSILGVVMYFSAPYIIGVMTPDREIVELGVVALRTEAWAEPMYAVAIVAYGALVGAGDTFIPCCLNLGSMWVIRISLAALLAPVYGLWGVWLAMCIELCIRGALFLWRLRSASWTDKIDKLQKII